MRNTDGRIALIREGDFELNKQQGKVFNPKLKVKKTLYIPSQILELGWVVRGQAGAGKTVFLDRIMKETIDAGHSVILHNVKGDELKKINGYCSFYHIEPWTANTWEIDFLNLCADDEEQAEDTKIRTFIEAFSKIPDDFFDKAGISVMEAIARCAIKSNKDENGKVKVGLEELNRIWLSFNIDESLVKSVDMTDISQVKNAVQQESQQLRMINDFLKKWFRTSSMYIDPKNEKTSLCVLASVIEIMRKFESLSKFWKNNAIDLKTKEKKVFDIKEWINRKKDRKVIILSNSNMFGDVANSYISAFINLITTQLIDSNYEPVKEIHFILDEFVQLSSINLNDFLKLPDVGRGKLVRVKIAFQRTSQVRNTWKDFDSESFASAFQNKFWASSAEDDKKSIREELGKQKITIYKSSSNWSAQGQSSSNQTETKMEDVVNVDSLNKELGVMKMYIKDEKTGEYLKDKNSGLVEPLPIGVKILCNFVACKQIALIKFPFVNFDKSKNEVKIKSSSSAGSISSSSNEEKNNNKEELLKETLQNTKNSMELLPNQPIIERETEEKSIGQSVASDVIAEVLDHSGALSVALKISEVIEGMENFTQNSNVINSATETEDEIEKMINEVKNNKNKEKTR